MANASSSRKKILLDVDTGIDDAQGLVMALSRVADVDVVAVTCVCGNSPLQQVCKNTVRVMRLCDRLDVPVYAGCESPFFPRPLVHDPVHGLDGLGDRPDQEPRGREDYLTLLQDIHASLVICRLAKQYKGDLTLAALGPLTNVALALKLDPQLGDNLKECIIMGGNMRGMGNVVPGVEFNFWGDPEAAQICVSNLPRTTIVTWECGLETVFPWDWLDRMAAIDTPKGRFFATVCTDQVHRSRNVRKNAHYISCDPIAVAVALNPRAVIAESKKCFCEVELHGSVTRGQMVVDWMGRSNNPPNVTLVTKTNPEAIMTMYEQMLK